MFNKFILSDNSVLSDKSLALEDYHASNVALTLVAGEDVLYVGSKYPITRKFLKVSTANASAASVAVRYWDGSAWRSAVNVQDGTASAGAPLAVSGQLAWETDKRFPWTRDDTTVGGNNKITGFGTTTYQDYFWLEISFSANVTASLAWAGDVLCSDARVGDEYPDLLRANVLEAFETGKTTWEAQRVAASKIISQDLKRLWSPAGASAVLESDQLALACVSKTAEIVFRGLGQGYADSMAAARKEYDARMDKRHFAGDDNANGRADVADVSTIRVTRLYR